MTTERDHEREIGARLRAARQQQRLSLRDVEEKSGGRWKAVVVGSYERGERAVTAARLCLLAAFYGIPVERLICDTSNEERQRVARNEEIIALLTEAYAEITAGNTP